MVHIELLGARFAAALLRALVAANLDRTLEVHLHRVRELEGLEVGVRQYRGGCTEVFDLGEARHQLRARHATTLIDQLDRCPLAIVRHTVAHQHIELAVVVLDREHHRHGLTDLHQTRHLRRPRTLTDLDLHPATDVVTGKVGPYHVQHIDRERPERDRFLVLIVPGAAQLPGLIPHLLHLRIVLQHDDVLEVRAGVGVGTGVSVVQDVVRVAGRTALVDTDVEAGRRLAEPGRQMNAVDVAVVALGEDDAEEGLVELDVHLHALLFALHVQRHDLGHVLER
uniref:Putative secreted protein n=1 Tax=Anopheles darlingi TaxID=43151 RepID=A0A2M4D382_ANODA